MVSVVFYSFSMWYLFCSLLSTILLLSEIGIWNFLVSYPINNEIAKYIKNYIKGVFYVWKIQKTCRRYFMFRRAELEELEVFYGSRKSWRSPMAHRRAGTLLWLIEELAVFVAQETSLRTSSPRIPLGGPHKEGLLEFFPNITFKKVFSLLRAPLYRWSSLCRWSPYSRPLRGLLHTEVL